MYGGYPWTAGRPSLLQLNLLGGIVLEANRMDEVQLRLQPLGVVLALADLMHGAREVILLHEGEEYRLRITKAGKLILTK